MADSFETLTAVDALTRFGEGSLSPETLVDDCLARIARDNPKVNAFTCVNEVEARRLAAASAQRWQVRRLARWTEYLSPSRI